METETEMTTSEWTYWDLDWHYGEVFTDEDAEDPTKGRMWQPFMRLPDKLYYRLRWASPIADWPDDVAADSYDDFPIEDLPLAVEAPMVSQRTRELIERVAPGCAQFLPVTMTHRGKPMRIGRYWVMNMVKPVDCLDPELGTTTPVPERIAKHMPADSVQLVYERTRFLRSVVPADAALFRMRKQYITVVARDDVREAFESHGITGVKFKPLPFRVV